MKSLKQKISKPGLLPLIVIAIAAGICCADILPLWGTRIFITFNAIFSSFLGFFIPLLILGLVAPAIAEIGGNAGRMLLITAAIAYVFTYLSGLMAYFTAASTFPSLIGVDSYIADVSAGTEDLTPYFTIAIQPLMDVVTALILAFVLGLGTAQLRTASLRNGLYDFRTIIMMVIKRVIIPLLPLYIFGIFLNLTASGQALPILITFAKIIGVIFVMHVVLLVFQYCVASLFSGRNPLKSLLTMMPAYFTALGTQSSAATIPVTLERTMLMGVRKPVAEFVIPLCATIHMSGSTLKIVSCALALMITRGMPYDFSMFAAFIGMLAISIIAAPGVPGGAIMASLGILSSILGFTEADNALMIALYISMDSFGTACNVTGDGAIAQIVNRLYPAADSGNARLSAATDPQP